MFKDIYSFENKIVHGAYILKFFSAAHLMTFVNIQTILYGGGGGGGGGVAYHTNVPTV